MRAADIILSGMKSAISAALGILWAATAAAQSTPAPDLARWQAHAAAVTITRDDWGIAHVRGRTDADAVFGMVYAQAEDDFNRIETNYLNAMGRLAEAEGDSVIWRDLRMKFFISPDSLKAWYARSPAWLRTLMNAWADGLNFYLQKHPEVRSITLMTHFADADGASGVAGQLAWFDTVTRAFEVPRCMANSAALLRYPQTRADWVRPGIMLYGCSPFADQSARELGLKPAMTLSSEIIGVQHLQPGECVGYGFSYEAQAETTLGVVACGYGDGYPRHAPSGTPVLVAGQRARSLGRVSMDLLCVDISDIPEAYIGTPVTLWGDGLSADEVAAAAGTVSYQLLCALAARVPVTEAA